MHYMERTLQSYIKRKRHVFLKEMALLLNMNFNCLGFIANSKFFFHSKSIIIYLLIEILATEGDNL